MAKRLAINQYNKNKREFLVDFAENESLYGECFVEDKDDYVLDVAKKVLDEGQFEIISLCLLSGYKRREVAEILKIPIGTVTWRYNEALKTLKQFL